MNETDKKGLTGKTAVVTGASSGIGRAIALRFARAGAKVLIHYRHRADKAEAVKAEVASNGGVAETAPADLTRPEDIDELVRSSWDLWGGVDIWVNNAGADILTGSPSPDPEQRLRQLLEMDLLGTIRCCWRVAPLMRKAGKGALLNMSWDLIDHGMAGRNPEMFSAVKGGIASFSRSLARSLAPTVRVNALAPGWIETAFALDVMNPDNRKAVEMETPMKRMGLPEDVANAALYLASDEASFVTGQVVKVNGGLS